MTSVPQLPVEAAPPQALPKGQTPRMRTSDATEESVEGAFAALLALVLPERIQAPKAEVVVAFQSLDVEGEGVHPEDGEDSVAAKAGVTARPGGPARAATLTHVATAAPAAGLQEIAVEAAPLQDPELITGADTMAERPASAQVVQEAVEVEESPRQSLPRAIEMEESARPAELEDAEIRPGPMAREVGRTEEQLQLPRQPVPPEAAEANAAAPVSVEEPPVVSVAAAPTEGELPVHAAPAPTAEAPRQTSTLAPRNEARQTTGVETAPEPRRMVETTKAPVTPPAADAPVIEFQVRKQSLTQEVRPVAEAPEWTRSLQDKATEAPPAVTRRPTPAAPTVEITAPVQALPEEVVVKHPREVQTASRHQLKAAQPKPPELPRTERQPTPVAAEPGPTEQPSGDSQAKGDNSDDTSHAPTEPIERKSAATNAKSIPTSVPVEARSEHEPSQPAPLKPVAPATTAAQPANAPQIAAPASSVPLQASTGEPQEARRPLTAAHPASEPEIAAKLHQQNGRTTLNVVLHDERLGRVALQLVERGGWIETAIRASDPRTAQTLSSSAACLFEALQQRGLAATTGGGAAAWDAQEGQRRDNPQRDQESQRRRFRLRRTGGGFEGAMSRAEV